MKKFKHTPNPYYNSGGCSVMIGKFIGKLLFLSLLIILFYGCKNEEIKPNPTIDPPPVVHTLTYSVTCTHIDFRVWYSDETYGNSELVSKKEWKWSYTPNSGQNVKLNAVGSHKESITTGTITYKGVVVASAVDTGNYQGFQIEYIIP